MSSPVGLLFLARSERGLRHLEFMDRKSLKRVVESHATPDSTWEPSLFDLKSEVEQLEQYFSGMLTDFDIPLDLVGSDFQMAVWKELLRIPYGRTTSYGAIARRIGQPRAARAVGLANNQNPIAIVVPCHRVVGSDGSLTGYGGGMPAKRWLLDHESRIQRLDLGDGPAKPKAIDREPMVTARADRGTKRAPATRSTTAVKAKRKTSRKKHTRL
jgi:methylated-DNA-[protein]-cysteine S-methyltransferase